MAGEPPDAKARGPEHNVTLAEESGVVDLLNKAQKARARVEQDPQIWPECVKFYGEILRKYPNTVYLDRWEGPDRSDMAWKNGLYKSTRERVARDIASLPAGGLAIYRVINDPPARALFQEAQEHFDERKMEQAAQEFFPTSWGDDAADWLAAIAFDRGASRQAIVRSGLALKHPSLSVSKIGLLIRTLLAQAELGDRASAEKTLLEIQALAPAAKEGEFRVGHVEGPAALEKLRARIQQIGNSPGGAGVPARAARSWPTYFGNAAHNGAPPTRKTIGLRKWSVPIIHLLHGPAADPAVVGKIQDAEGNPRDDPTMNFHLTVQDSYFYLCDWNKVVAYPIGNPLPGQPGESGNAKFVFPTDFQPPAKTSPRDARRRVIMSRMGNGTRHHPHFCTVTSDRLYYVAGAEPVTLHPDQWRGMEMKQPSNYLVALGRQGAAGTLESGKLAWSLQPDARLQAFESHSEADQKWLKSVFFVSAPTCESGVLYVMAVQVSGMQEAWVAAFDAENGRLLWRTQVCSSNPVFVGNEIVQPDLGLPVAVSGGTVFVCTNLGAVGALDAMSGAIKWIRIYDRMAAVDRFNPRGYRVATEFWGPNPPIVYENLLIVTPQDSETMYAYNIETGRREWDVPRIRPEDRERGENAKGLRHVLGITNGVLILTGSVGSEIKFIEARSGKVAGDKDNPTNFDSPVKGRGVVTENSVLVPTEKALVNIDTSLDGGKFRPRVREVYKWANPEAEAGNVFVAGDVLYTASRTYVNAYFDPKEIEARIRERIAQEPGNLANYSELADVYHKSEDFDKALATLESGLQAAEKAKDDPKAAPAAAEMRRQKFDALLESGKRRQNPNDQPKWDLNAAYAAFQKALEVARAPGQADVMPVVALRALAENCVLRGDMSQAVAHYQQIIAQHGDAVYAYVPESSSKARLFARGRIEELKKKTPASYEKVEAEAKAALEKAGSDAAKIEAVLAQYPNANTCGAALLKLAQLAMEKDPDQTRQHAQRFLSRYPDSPDAPGAAALLAAACERTGLLGPAKDVLRRLASRPEFAGKTIAFDPLDLKARPAAPVAVDEWAHKRLEAPQFQQAASGATHSLGDGKLKLAWTRPVADQSLPLLLKGMAPQAMRRNLFYVENQAELAVLEGASRGEELWTPRPKLPADLVPRPGQNDPMRFQRPAQLPVGLWAEHVLVIGGAREIAAYDSKDKGKIVWRREVKGAPLGQTGGMPYNLQAGSGRVVIATPSGSLAVLDAMTGDELWRTQIEGNQLLGNPAIGDGFAAIAAHNPTRLLIFDLDTGTRKGVIDVPSNITLAPVAVGDRVYYVERGTLLSAADGITGKLAWQQDIGRAVTMLDATRELVAVSDGQQVTAINAAGPGERRKWSPVLLGAGVRDIHADGDDLYVAVNIQQKAKLISFSIRAEGKIQWDVDMSADLVNGIPLDESTVAAGHLLQAQPTWDQTGDKPAAAVLVDRRTGRLAWAESLASDQRPRDAEGIPQPAYRLQMIDGGVVLTEGRKRSAYLIPDTRNLDDQITALAAQLAKNPADVDLRAKLAARRFEKGEREAALRDFSALLADKDLREEKFVMLYAEFSRLRQDMSQKKEKRAISFARAADGSKLDAAPASWAGVPELVLDGWRDIYLPSDDETSGAIKKGLWAGPDDLKVSFRGAYDDTNLHLLFVVTDDKHKNEATEGPYCDLGDSVKVVVDADRDGGGGFRGDDFEFGASLNNAGAVLAWRWVERGRYLSGATPLQPAPVIVRKEAEKQTTYKFTLPLESLKLRPEAGRKFGFSFAVHDQDEGGSVTKSIGASPGALRPAVPSLFGEGVLQGK